MPPNEIPVAPLDVIFLLPLALVCEDSAADPFGEAVDALSRSGHHWKHIDDALRRGEEGLKADNWAWSELCYLHRYVQDFVYGSTGSAPASRLYRFNPEQARLFHVESSRLRIQLEIRSIYLHVFQEGLMILSMDMALGQDSEARWQDALNLIGEVRKLYFSHYILREDELVGGGAISDVWIDPLQNRVAPQEQLQLQLADALKQRRPTLLPHWNELLIPLSVPGTTVAVDSIGDSRMPVMAFIGTPNISALTDDDWNALAQADGAGFMPYAPAFRRAELARAIYDRWYEEGSETHRQRYVVGPLNFCTVLQAEADSGWVQGAREKWRRHYLLIFLLAVYQLSTLRTIQRRLAYAAASIPSGLDKVDVPLKARRRKFRVALERVQQAQFHLARFSGRAWFREVTPQIQGQELYELMRNQLRLDSVYNEVTHDKQIVADWVTAQDASMHEDWRDEFEKKLSIIGRLAAVFTALGMSVLIGPAQKMILGLFQLLGKGWEACGGPGFTPWQPVLDLSADLVVAMVIGLPFWFVLQRIFRRIEER